MVGEGCQHAPVVIEGEYSESDLSTPPESNSENDSPSESQDRQSSI